MRQKLALVLSTLSLLSACESDDGTPPPDPTPTPTTFAIRLENVAPWTVLKAGSVAVKLGATSPGALGPGDAYEVSFTAGKGQKLSFASMFGESNDWFFGPGPDGIALYDGDGMALSGDVTSQVQLWNAGTEIDQEPGVGDSVGPNQPAPDYGAPDPIAMVRAIPKDVTLSDGSQFTLPDLAEMIRVTVTPGNGGLFTIRIENVSTATTLVTSGGMRPIHISPTVWALHTKPAPMFDAEAADRGQGLEYIAESGRVATLAGVMRELSGVSTPVSPGVYVVHQGGEPLFSLGLADRAEGLEHIAEDGRPQSLAEAISVDGIYDTAVGATGVGPIRPGDAYELSISALPGDRFSFASMFGYSNDWVFASRADGIALFDAAGQPLSGDVTDDIGIFDVGTEIDQELAIGADTGPQQAGPDTGAADPIAQVREVPSAVYGVPASAHLRVTITPQ